MKKSVFQNCQVTGNSLLYGGQPNEVATYFALYGCPHTQIKKCESCTYSNNNNNDQLYLHDHINSYSTAKASKES